MTTSRLDLDFHAHPLAPTEERARALADRAERALQDDLSARVATLGGVMIGTGCLLMVVGVAFAFSLTVMVWGSIITTVAAVLRYKGLGHRVRALEIASELLVETAAARARQETFDRVFTEGVVIRLRRD